MKLPNYYLFIDESGDASLNNLGKDFLLTAVIIERGDFDIIQGYMRLLKRNFLQDDYKVIHTTDLFERPYQKYRRLYSGRNKRMNAFMHELRGVLDTIPFQSCVYHIDKNKLRSKLGYKPAKGRKSTSLNIDLPYEIAATQAIFDFTDFLKKKKSTGEIVIESRMHKDSKFVNYFDNARKASLPGGAPNMKYKDVLKSIPSLFILNKDAGNIGLEIADIVSYITYRTIVGDPWNRIKLSPGRITELFSVIKKSAHIGTPCKLINKIS